MPTSLPPASDENYADFIITYTGDSNQVSNSFPDYEIEFVGQQFAILYIPIQSFPSFTPENYSYGSLPKCYTFMDQGAAEATGALRLRNQPFLSLTGDNTLIAIIDSGIDIQNPLFRSQSGRSRVYRLWDQTLDIGPHPSGLTYGTEFTQEQLTIDFDISSDEIGHGTFLAGIAAGNSDPDADFTGIAPEAELIIIKLKPAKEYLRNYYCIPDNVTVYQENDLMAAIFYATNIAANRNIPLSICCGLGSSQGAHIGTSPLTRMMNIISSLPGTFICTPAGNEGNTRHHYHGILESDFSSDRVELRVPETPENFIVELWGERSQDYRIDISSPVGETRRIPVPLSSYRESFRFVFEQTQIEAVSLRMEQQSGKSLIQLRFLNPSPGIWSFTVYFSGPAPASFDMWLPVVPILSTETYFLRSSPDATITSPGDAANVLTVTAYNYRNNSIFLDASRGFLPDQIIKPEIAAPGVDIIGPTSNQNFVSESGTSIAAACCTGLGSLLFQWSIILGNAPYTNGISLKNYLIKSPVKLNNIPSPSPVWGYGIVDLYKVFQEL